MKLSQLPDDFTPEQFMQLDKESLDQIPYTVMHLNCHGKGCKNGTHVRDYGVSPYYFLHRNSRGAANNPGKYWLNLSRKMWLCAKHWKILDRLGPIYGYPKVEERVLDLGTAPLGKLNATGHEFKTVDKVETHEQKPR